MRKLGKNLLSSSSASSSDSTTRIDTLRDRGYACDLSRGMSRRDCPIVPRTERPECRRVSCGTNVREGAMRGCSGISRCRFGPRLTLSNGSARGCSR